MSRHHRWYEDGEDVEDGDESDNQMDENDSHRDEDTPVDEMDYWLQRCSICFDSQLDLCLEYCRDQFCIDCFERYVTEVVTSSWGLSITKIKCPVCRDCIPYGEWSKYVPQHVIDTYNKFNQPYRSFSRFCPDCQDEVKACEYNRNSGFTRESRIILIQETIKNLILSYDPDVMLDHSSPMRRLLSTFDDVYRSYGGHNLQELHKHTVKTLFTWADQREYEVKALAELHSSRFGRIDIKRKFSRIDVHRQAASISKQLVALEVRPEGWKRLQFSHIKSFPFSTCNNCQLEMCLQCGEAAHPDISCTTNMEQKMLNNTVSTEVIETLQWKLKNSRPCPSCSIMINRDEGCNKVDCSLCGHTFCWSCRSSWSEKCGFYQCGDQNTSTNLVTASIEAEKVSEIKTELGVPNVFLIQTRLSTTVQA